MNTNIRFSGAAIKDAKWLKKRYKSFEDDLTQLVAELASNPKAGINLGKGLYKSRFQIKAKRTGRDGGGRVITWFVIQKNEVIVIAIYDKSEEESIALSEILMRYEEAKKEFSE
jgi:hypothetical protein